MKQPTLPGSWRFAPGPWPESTSESPGRWFCDDCLGSISEGIWWWQTDPGVAERDDPNWIWLCESCVRRRGITW